MQMNDCYRFADYTPAYALLIHRLAVCEYEGFVPTVYLWRRSLLEVIGYLLRLDSGSHRLNYGEGDYHHRYDCLSHLQIQRQL